VVTSLKRRESAARALYEDMYCARGEIKNRIQECQGDLFCDRTSTASLAGNQLRLWFTSMACVLICATIRVKLLKVGARVLVCVRRIRFAMALGHPRALEWGEAHRRFCAPESPRFALPINNGDQKQPTRHRQTRPVIRKPYPASRNTSKLTHPPGNQPRWRAGVRKPG
jgi:hypothetical protein